MGIDRASSFRVLESLTSQSVGGECRRSLAGVIACNTVIRRHIFSDPLSAWPIALRVRKAGGLERHRRGGPGVGRGCRHPH